MYDCSAIPAATLFHAGPVERLHEGLRRDAHVPVLFHVQVDELRHLPAVGVAEAALHRGAIQQFESVGQHLDRMLAGQRPDLREDRRDLDRDDFDLGALEGFEITLQPVFGLAFTQQRLAQHVDVHPHAFVAALLQVLGQQFPVGRQDHVGRLTLHVLLDQRHGHAGQIAAEGLETL